MARALLALCLLTVVGLTAQGLPPDDEAALGALLDRFFATQAAGDADAFAALWHSAAPGGTVRVAQARTLGSIQTLEFSNLRVARWTMGPDGPSARVVIEAAVTDRRTKATTTSSWTRDITFRQEDGAWRVFGEASPCVDLAAALARAPGDEERLALLEANADLLTSELRLAVSRQSSAAFAKRDPELAVALMRLAVTIAERLDVPADLASAWLDLALHDQAAGNLASAIDGFGQALGHLRAAGDTARLADTEMNMASIRYRQASLESGRQERLALYREAADHYRRALEGYEAVGETGWHASILHSLGNTSYLLGQWDAALDYYQRTLAIQEQALASAGSSPTMLQIRGVAAAYQAVGMVLEELGDYPSALEALEKSLAHFGSFDDRSGTANVQQAIGQVYRLQGNFALAIRHFLTALDVAATMRADARDRVNEAKLLAQVGEVYALEQRYRTALDYFGKSLELFERAKDRPALGTLLGGIGGVHFLRGEFEEALDDFRKSLLISEELGDERAAAFACAQIGLALAADGKPGEARESYRRSLALAERAGDRTATAIALTLEASAATSLDDTDEALGLAARAAAIASEIDTLDVLARVHLVRGDAYRARDEIERAEAAVREALFTVERIRAAGIRADQRFFNDTTSPYLALIHLLVRQGRTADAFALLERARQVRMQGLLDGASIVKGLSADEQQQERRLRGRVVSLRAQARKAQEHADQDPAALAARAEDLSAAAAALRAFEADLYAAHPDLEILRARGEPDTLDVAAETVVDERTAVLAFAVTEHATYLFAVTKPGASGVAPPPDAAPGSGPEPQPAATAAAALDVFAIDITPADLARRIAAFRDLVAARSAEADQKAQELYSLLVAPAASKLAAKSRLLVVPDGALWALPFQALRSPAGRYVIEDAAVAYGASLAALAAAERRGRNGQPSRPAGLLSVGLGDPSPVAVSHLALVRPDLAFEPMAHAEREARAIAELAPGPQTRLRAGKDARADEVRTGGAAAGLLHLAVPAVLVDASPLHTLLAFAAPGGGAPDDALVEAGDVMAWDLAARAVVLSRAHGDPGPQSAGAAARALAWAWLVAGVPTTVMTQWVVDAPSTSDLMRALHRRLAASEPPDSAPLRVSEALRLATLPLLRGETRHPYYWAHVMVVGDAR